MKFYPESWLMFCWWPCLGMPGAVSGNYSPVRSSPSFYSPLGHLQQLEPRAEESWLTGVMSECEKMMTSPLIRPRRGETTEDRHNHLKSAITQVRNVNKNRRDVANK